MTHVEPSQAKITIGTSEQGSERAAPDQASTMFARLLTPLPPAKYATSVMQQCMRAPRRANAREFLDYDAALASTIQQTSWSFNRLHGSHQQCAAPARSSKPAQGSVAATSLHLPQIVRPANTDVSHICILNFRTF